MSKHVFAQLEYRLPARCISGTREQKLEQIDSAIQELLDIKVLECAEDRDHVRFLAVPKRSHWFAMTVTILLMLMMLVLLLGTRSAHAQEVAVTQPTREQILQRIAALEADLAVLKALVQQSTPAATRSEAPAEAPAPGDLLREIKVGASLDLYYGYNFNRPVGRVNLLRAYDVLSNSFTLNQAGLVLEAAPDPKGGRRIGGRLDLQFGQATETLQGSPVNEPRPWVYRNVFQAYGTYVAPVGSGLTIDFGKWASALGYEGNYSKDQINYSRSYLFDFLPFYHMGARVAYPLNDRVTLNYWLVNGVQQTEAFNDFKDQMAGVTLRPAKTVTWNINYHFGEEHPDVQPIAQPAVPTLPTQPGLSITPVPSPFNGKLQIFDAYLSWQASPSTLFAFEGDYVTSQSAPPATAAHVSGGAAYLRRQLTPRTALGVRGEVLADRGGLFSGESQRLEEATATYDYRVNDGLLVRTEWRRDSSTVPFFLSRSVDARKKTQDTATLGLIWWWGTKQGAW